MGPMKDVTDRDEIDLLAVTGAAEVVKRSAIARQLAAT